MTPFFWQEWCLINALLYSNTNFQVSATSVGSSIGAHFGATPKVSITSSLAGGGGGGGAVVFSSLHNQELDPETNTLMQRILSLLLRVRPQLSCSNIAMVS